MDFECPFAFSTDVYYQCSSGTCIKREGLCNEVDNCGDGSDERDESGVSRCGGPGVFQIESLSGKAATLVTAEQHTATTLSVFSDRNYHFDSLGDFSGKTFVHYYNDDKMIVHNKVMMKIRANTPSTVFIVKQPTNHVPWLEHEGFEQSSSLAGVAFSGPRSTRHKEWLVGNEDGYTVPVDHFDASEVWVKNFAAGTIILPGSGEGDGGFLVFLEAATTVSNPIPAPSPPPTVVNWFQHAPNDWCGQSNSDMYTAASSQRAGWNFDGSPNGGWRWCGISSEECQVECVNLGECASIYFTPNQCCFPSKEVCQGSDAPGGFGGFSWEIAQ
jgi:hypothetical protein